MIKVVTTKSLKYSADMVVHLVRQQEKRSPKCSDKQVQKVIDRVYDAGDFAGKEGQILIYYPESAGAGGKLAARILLVGLGKDDPDRELFRKAGGTISSGALKTKTEKILIHVPEVIGFDPVELAECLTEGLVLGSYQFKKYKTKDDNDENGGQLEKVALYSVRDRDVRKGMKQGETAAVATCAARDMAHEPGNYWTPTHFATYSRELAKKYGFKVKVLGKAEMKKQGMGGIVGINQGSEQPPTLSILEYRTGRKKVPTVLIVGKGLTFDSGGISIKPSGGMQEMKYDMCGGAAVLAAMQAVGEEKPRHVDVVALVPATENLPGPAAIKPGDIITQYGGKTVEVINTDAEGRLILADALAYGVKKYKPAAVIDLATLTGAVIVGLGHHRTGLLSTDDRLVDQLIAAGDRSGEPLWRLPLGPEYTKQLKSAVADLKNIGNRTGGTITAGAFLQEFVGDVPWAHLDIAGTAWDFTEKPYIPKGPSGTGVRTLLELIRGWKDSV